MGMMHMQPIKLGVGTDTSVTWENWCHFQQMCSHSLNVIFTAQCYRAKQMSLEDDDNGNG